MTWQDPLIVTLLVCGVGVTLLCCLGLLLMDDVFTRLHYVGPATTLGPVAIAAAILVAEALTTAGIKAILITVVIVATSPALTHATARAARARQIRYREAPPSNEVEEAEEQEERP